MKLKKTLILVMIPILLLGTMYLVDPNGFWHSPLVLLWPVIGSIPLATLQSLWNAELFRQTYARISSPNRLLWIASAFFIGATLWFFASTTLFDHYPALLGLSEDGRVMVVLAGCFPPGLFAYALILQRISIWYLG